MSELKLPIQIQTPRITTWGKKLTVSFSVNTWQTKAKPWSAADVTLEGNVGLVGDMLNALHRALSVAERDGCRVMRYPSHFRGWEPRYWDITITIQRTPLGTLLHVEGVGGNWEGAVSALLNYPYWDDEGYYHDISAVAVEGDGDMILRIAAEYLPHSITLLLQISLLGFPPNV